MNLQNLAIVLNSSILKRRIENNLYGEKRHWDQWINVSTTRIADNQCCIIIKYWRLVDLSYANHYDSLDDWTCSHCSWITGTYVQMNN